MPYLRSFYPPAALSSYFAWPIISRRARGVNGGGRAVFIYSSGRVQAGKIRQNQRLSRLEHSKRYGHFVHFSRKNLKKSSIFCTFYLISLSPWFRMI